MSTKSAPKSASAYRTISEVADELELPQHVLRFWETKFNQVKPLKRGGGRRYYRPEDVALLRRIRDLLHAEGYTIRGVQKLLSDEARGAGAGTDAEEGAPLPAAKRDKLRTVAAELEDLQVLLDKAMEAG